MNTLAAPPDAIEEGLAEAKRRFRRHALREIARDYPELIDELLSERRATNRLSVSTFADRLDVSVTAAYRLLEQGAVPGAFKIHPDVRGSRWFIPADAPARFVARGDGGDA